MQAHVSASRASALPRSSAAGAARSRPSSCGRAATSAPRRAARVAPAALATCAGGAARRGLRRTAGATASASGAAVVAAAAAPAQPRVVNVPLGDRSYPIYIGPGLLDDGARLRQHIPGSTALLVTNETIAPLYLKRAVDALSGDGRVRVVTCVLRDGEEYKTLEELNKIFTAALEARLDRGTTFVALGGGVIGDTVGFAASAYQRGVAFVQIPTTLMAMVDSSVGGKTGVNHPAGKNMIGAFWQPRCVLVDTATLDTLPARELASGMAEVVKYGLIRDAALFRWLETGGLEGVLARDPAALAHCVAASCENKAAVVAADEREAGLRATLNLGHTFGHAIETGTGYGTWLHGEAVAAGTVMAAAMSRRLGWIDDALLQRTVDIMRRCQLPVEPPQDGSMTRAKFESLMAVDKKAENGKMRLILLKGQLGSCVFTGDFDVKALHDTIAEFCPTA